MSDNELRHLFETVLTAPPPDTADIDATIRTGRRRRRWRGALVSAGAVLAVLGITLAVVLPGVHPRPVSPAAVLVTDPQQILGSWHTVQLDGKDVRNLPLYVKFLQTGTRLSWSTNARGGPAFSVSVRGEFRAQQEDFIAGMANPLPEERNAAVVEQANEAQVVAATSASPRKLLLVFGGRTIAAYEAVPSGSTDLGTVVTEAAQILGSWQTVALDGKDVRAVRDGRKLPLDLTFQQYGNQLRWSANDLVNSHSGVFRVSRGGQFHADPGAVSLVGTTLNRELYTRNATAVEQATEARLVAATSTEPVRLQLLTGGRVVALYEPAPLSSPPHDSVLVTDPAQILGSWRTTRLDDTDVSAVVLPGKETLRVSFTRAGTQLGWDANDLIDQGGTFSLSKDGQFAAVETNRDLVQPPSGGEQYLRNPEVVKQADRIQVAAATTVNPRKLVLMRNGMVTAVFVPAR